MKKVKVVVFVDGDMVDQIFADWPIEVAVINNYIEEPGDEEVVSVLGEDSYVFVTEADVNEDLVRRVFKDVRS